MSIGLVQFIFFINFEYVTRTETFGYQQKDKQKKKRLKNKAVAFSCSPTPLVIQFPFKYMENLHASSEMSKDTWMWLIFV